LKGLKLKESESTERVRVRHVVVRTMKTQEVVHKPMTCSFCETNMVLIPLRQLFKREISSLDFDEEGRQYKICPNCFSLDNFNLRESRALMRAIQDNQATFSRRDKKKVVQYLCGKQRLGYEEKKIAVSNVTNQIKNKTDKHTIQYISNHFNIPSIKVSMLFYNVQVYWALMKK